MGGTYQPYTNNYGDPRDFSTTGNLRSHEGIDIFSDRWIPIFLWKRGGSLEEDGIRMADGDYQ